MYNLPAGSTGTAIFCLIMGKILNMQFNAMNVSSTTALTSEFKPFEAPILPTDDPWFSWLKHRILNYFGDWFKKIEGRPGACEMSEKRKMFI